MCTVDSWKLASHPEKLYSFIVCLFVCFQVSEHSNRKEEDPQVFNISPLCEQKEDSGWTFSNLLASYFNVMY